MLHSGQYWSIDYQIRKKHLLFNGLQGNDARKYCAKNKQIHTFFKKKHSCKQHQAEIA